MAGTKPYDGHDATGLRAKEKTPGPQYSSVKSRMTARPSVSLGAITTSRSRSIVLRRDGKRDDDENCFSPQPGDGRLGGCFGPCWQRRRGSRRAGKRQLRLARRAHLYSSAGDTHGAGRRSADPALADSEPGPNVARPGAPAPNVAQPRRFGFGTGLMAGLFGAGLLGMLIGQRLLRRPRRSRLDVRSPAPGRPRGPGGLLRHEVVPQQASAAGLCRRGRAMPAPWAAACPRPADGP